jgi:flagellar secretion chaperone FliS
MKSISDAKHMYQDSAVRGATPIELVILLYDAAIDDMRRAMSAMQSSDIETRSNQIAHALIILQQLQGTLDFERGGGAARQFEQFYNLTRAKLLEAQLRGSLDLIRQQVRAMSEVRDCWAEAKRMLQPATGRLTDAKREESAGGGASKEWNA